MMVRHDDHIITFSLFEQFPQLYCCMTTRALGDIRPRKNSQPIPKQLHVLSKNIISMEQVHGNQVALVDGQSRGSFVPKTDGLVTPAFHLYLAVNTADCVPVFLYDPIRKVCGVVHAGWRGTLADIIGQAIGVMRHAGSKPENIYAAIGPHIGGCCYSVPPERAVQFKSLMSAAHLYQLDWLYQVGAMRFVDLGAINRWQMMVQGIQAEHIDSPISCTSCQNDLFFSYRKDSTETFGEMLGIIGMRNSL